MGMGSADPTTTSTTRLMTAPTNPLTRATRVLRTIAGIWLALCLAAAAGAQTTVVLPTVRVVAAAPGDDRFALDDALLDGIDLTDAQRERVVALRRAQLAELDATRPQILDAIEAMRRAHEHGDVETARAIMALMQMEMQETRAWRLALLRGLLTAEQRQRFDANVDAMLGEDRQGER
jgi:Spy/CpxP family protein refolding chaperone